MTQSPEIRSHPVNYDLDDLMALSRLVPRGPVQILRITGAIVVILLIVTVIFEAWALTGSIDWTSLIIGLIIGGLILLFSSRRVRAKLWLKITRRSPLHAAQSFILTQSALRIASAKATTEIPWTTFRDMKVAEERLFIFMTKRLAYIIPSRAFDGEADFTIFVEAARQYWAQRHRL